MKPIYICQCLQHFCLFLILSLIWNHTLKFLNWRTYFLKSIILFVKLWLKSLHLFTDFGRLWLHCDNRTRKSINIILHRFQCLLLLFLLLCQFTFLILKLFNQIFFRLKNPFNEKQLIFFLANLTMKSWIFWFPLLIDRKIFFKKSRRRNLWHILREINFLIF